MDKDLSNSTKLSKRFRVGTGPCFTQKSTKLQGTPTKYLSVLCHTTGYIHYSDFYSAHQNIWNKVVKPHDFLWSVLEQSSADCSTNAGLQLLLTSICFSAAASVRGWSTYLSIHFFITLLTKWQVLQPCLTNLYHLLEPRRHCLLRAASSCCCLFLLGLHHVSRLWSSSEIQLKSQPEKINLKISLPML